MISAEHCCTCTLTITKDLLPSKYESDTQWARTLTIQWINTVITIRYSRFDAPRAPRRSAKNVMFFWTVFVLHMPELPLHFHLLQLTPLYIVYISLNFIIRILTCVTCE